MASSPAASRLGDSLSQASRIHTRGITTDVGVACYASSPSMVELYVTGSDGKLRVASITAQTVMDA